MLRFRFTWRRQGWLLFVLLWFVACGSAGPETEGEQVTETPVDLTQQIIGNPMILQFHQLLNEHRLEVGCQPLGWHEDMAEVAQAHSDDMLAHQYFSHTSLSGQSPFDRLLAQNITFSAAAENIALGANDADQALQLWLASSGHRTNIENCQYQQHGLGVSGGYWTHMFRRPSLSD